MLWGLLPAACDPRRVPTRGDALVHHGVDKRSLGGRGCRVNYAPGVPLASFAINWSVGPTLHSASKRGVPGGKSSVGCATHPWLSTTPWCGLHRDLGPSRRAVVLGGYNSHLPGQWLTNKWWVRGCSRWLNPYLGRFIPFTLSSVWQAQRLPSHLYTLQGATQVL